MPHENDRRRPLWERSSSFVASRTQRICPPAGRFRATRKGAPGARFRSSRRFLQLFVPPGRANAKRALTLAFDGGRATGRLDRRRSFSERSAVLGVFCGDSCGHSRIRWPVGVEHRPYLRPAHHGRLDCINYGRVGQADGRPAAGRCGGQLGSPVSSSHGDILRASPQGNTRATSAGPNRPERDRDGPTGPTRRRRSEPFPAD